MNIKINIVILLFIVSVSPKPVVKKLNFNIFLLNNNKKDNSSAFNNVIKNTQDNFNRNPVKVLLTTNGVSRFPPILEFVVQRIQSMFSIFAQRDQYKPGEPLDPVKTEKPAEVNASENEVSDTNLDESGDDYGSVGHHGVDSLTGLPNVIVKPSGVHPGTYEVEIAVVVNENKHKENEERRLESFI